MNGAKVKTQDPEVFKHFSFMDEEGVVSCVLVKRWMTIEEFKATMVRRNPYVDYEVQGVPDRRFRKE